MTVQNTIRSKKWSGVLKNDAAVLKKKCKLVSKTGEKTVCGEWLRDNAYLFERTAGSVSEALRFLPPLPTTDEKLPRLYVALSDMYEREAITTESLRSNLQDKNLTAVECEALYPVCMAVLLHKAAVGSDNEKQIAKAVRALHTLPDVDFELLSDALNPVEHILSEDPSGDYSKMDDESRLMYRSLIILQSLHKKQTAESYARELLERARHGTDERTRHIGFYLLPSYPKTRGTFFLFLDVLVPLCLSILFGILLKRIYVPFLLFLPIRGITGEILIRLSQRGVPSYRLPRMQMEEIPKECRTLIVVSTILPSAESAGRWRERLSDIFITNGQPYINVCLLADLKNASTPSKAEDSADISAMSRVIASLNKEFGGGFMLAVRPRVYAETEGCFSGWERKRGAITQLVREIHGESGGFLHLSGDIHDLHETAYLMAVDADTSLPMQSTAELVRVAMHPMHKAVLDEERGIVRSGYGVLSPRVCTDLSSRKTLFQRIMNAECGISVYDNVVSERYQDLFGEGIFAGKGLLDVHTFYKVLNTALPEGRVLSHDSLEGGFLRCGFVSDVQVSDGFPKNPHVYYERLSRWVRGDFQNLPFVFGKNPLGRLSRYKLSDNMLRSLTCAVRFASFLLCIVLPDKPATIVAAVCLCSAAFGHWMSSLHSIMRRGTVSMSRLFYSDAFPTALGGFIRGVVQMAAIPTEGLYCLVSIVKALFRIFISHRKTLEWTTFAQSDAGNTQRKSWKTSFFHLSVSAIVFMSGNPVLRLGAILFLLYIPFIMLSGREESSSEMQLSVLKKELLTSYAAKMWQYFAENCNAGNHYLPPDNIQETPVYRVANRTSPTNIGLFMLSILTARDFGFIDTAEMYERLSQTLYSVESLETFGGNLLNWYDTKTLKPLHPKYVSTVDCGNFLCSMKTLQQGISEYVREDAKLLEISERIEALIQKSDLSALYNTKRNLFYIGMDVETGKKSDSYYDLLMSEARMTGYYAIGCGIVPRKHWQSLSRTMSKVGRYMGPVSWTGTMFEYFMPYLFLPAEKGTLGYEALKYCAYCQKNRVRRDKPFGISESGFYAFDRDFNYQYKAHGVQTLGLRRGLDDETVIAPYATFLMMQLEPNVSVRNLQKLENMGMVGQWGFYEALDFTKMHTEGKSYAIVRSFMAHHVGMSLLSVHNVLHNGILRERFMRDRQMRSAESLLEEGVPMDSFVYKRRQIKDAPRPRERIEPHKREIIHPTPMNPNASLWTNGELTMICSDVGASEVLYRGVSVFRHSKDILQNPGGPVIVLQGEDFSIPFAVMPDYGQQIDAKCTLSSTEVRYKSEKNGVSLRVCIRIHPETAALQYEIHVKNGARKPFKGSVIFYAEPMLTRKKDVESHPAFAKLFIEDNYNAQNDAFVFRKRERNGEKGVCMAAGLLKKNDYTCTRSRLQALKSGYGTGSLLRGDIHIPNAPGNGDCCLCMQIPCELSPKTGTEFSVVMTLASSETQALEKLLRVRKSGGVHKGAPVPFSDGKMESVLCEKLLPGAVFGAYPIENQRTDDSLFLPLRHLWKFGISGENPVLYEEIQDETDVQKIAPFMRAVYRLRRCGVSCDLALGYAEGGDYDGKIHREIRSVAKQECAIINLEENGIFPINLSKYEPSDKAFLKAISVLKMSGIKSENAQKTSNLICFGNNIKKMQNVKSLNFTGGNVSIGKNGQKPYKPWSIVLSNPAFGTLLSDKSLGFTWAINAHENKLTPWSNDVSTDNFGERLFLLLDGVYYDMIRTAKVRFSPDKVVYSDCIKGVEYEVEITVPKRAMTKVCSVNIHTQKDALVLYAMEPVLSEKLSYPSFVHVQKCENELVMTNPSSIISGVTVLQTDGKPDVLESDKTAFFFGQKSSAVTLGSYCVVGRKITLETKHLSFFLSFAKTENAALKMPFLPEFNQSSTDSILVHSAIPSFDRMVNVWLPWQVRKCRIEGRTGFDQCGGAWGFRDQIQDVSAFLYTDPSLVRRHLYRAAAVQFEEGDVLHWWHRLPHRDGNLRGVRTRYRDDLLWLVWLTAEYIRVTGNHSVLNTQIPFLFAETLRDDESERYFSPTVGNVKGSLFDHCVKAIDYALDKGPHGLLLMGGGDWNDGFNEIGIHGIGESVWLSMFMIVVLQKFAPLCDSNLRNRYLDEVQSLKDAIETSAWDGDHYIRAFMDDGTPIGKYDSQNSSECQIDSIVQSFAFYAGLSEKRVRLALSTASECLWDHEKGIFKLLSPPFTGNGKQVGYITAYPPGIRENGGQYTHAAVWFCDALYRSGQTELAFKLFQMLNPSALCEDPVRFSKYGGEPYAMAGDIPDVDRPLGCVGWSLYTGSAAWMYRTAVETILGMDIQSDDLRFRPHLSEELLPLSVEICVKSTKIYAKFENKQPETMIVDGVIMPVLHLDGGEHHVILR